MNSGGENRKKLPEKRVGSKDGDTFGAIIITVVGSVLLIILIVLTIK